jgi:hypothetical protein
MSAMGTKEAIDFFGNGLCLHCHLAKQELAEFIHFNKESELAWGNKDKQLQNDLDSILLKYPVSDRGEIIESYGWDLHVNQIKYPSIHRESIVLTIFSFLENELNNLCNILTQSVDSSVKLKDLKGQGVERSLLFLRKIAGFDFSSMSAEIDYIRSVNQLRNHIVHNGGVLPEDPKHRVNLFIASHQNLTGTPGNSLHVYEGFVPEFLQVLLDFFEKLQVQVSGHIKAYNSGA